MVLFFKKTQPTKPWLLLLNSVSLWNMFNVWRHSEGSFQTDLLQRNQFFVLEHDARVAFAVPACRVLGGSREVLRTLIAGWGETGTGDH